MKQIAYAVAIIGLGSLAVTSAQAADETQKVEKVEVTGSSIKRIAKEGALPVTTISREEIARSGVTTAQDLLAQIPSNFGGTVVSQNIGSTGNPSTAGLRGLPDKYTLVLLNGRRIADYSFGNSKVDLNSIPLSAVERVEILRDGASAIYGADAIAGVINFILRKDFVGAEVSAYGTDTSHGGGNVTTYNFTGGFGDLTEQRFNVFVSANHEEDKVLKATDRDFAGSAFRPDLGINKLSPRNGIPNLSFADTNGNSYGKSFNGNKSIQSSINPNAYLGCSDASFALSPSSTNVANCGTDFVKYIDIVPKQKHDSILGRVVFQLNETNQLYAEGMQVKDEVTSVYSPAPYTRTMIYPVTGRFYPKSITLPKGLLLKAGYKMPDGTVLANDTVLTKDLAVTPTGPLSGTWRTNAGGGRSDVTKQTADRFLFGAKGNIADWDYDTGFTHSENKGDITFGSGQFSFNALTPLVNSGEINVFGPQDAVSAAKLAGAQLTGQLEQSAKTKADEFDFRASRELFQLPYGPLAFAFGGSYRKETLEQFSAPILASGDQVGGAGPVPSVSSGRKVYAVFSELNITAYKDLEIQLAGRYDKYKNDFGVSFDKFSPKIGFRFNPVKELLIRGSAATGFRAPTLYENLRPSTPGNNTNGSYSDPVRCPNGKPVNSPNTVGSLQDECDVQLPAALDGGDKNLKPEKSSQWSVGFVFAPTSSFSGSLDYWSINIDDAIQRLSEISVLSNPSAFPNAFVRYNPALQPDPTSAWDPTINNGPTIRGSTNPNFPLAYIDLPYQNTAKFFAEGIDLNLAYKFKLDSIGNFTLNYDGTYMVKHGYQYAGQAEVSDVGVYRDYGPVPRYRHAVSLVFARGVWGASITNNFSASYKDFTDPNAICTDIKNCPVSGLYPESREVSSFSTWDLAGSWKGIKGLTVGLGIKNVFDEAAPASRAIANFQTGYDAQYGNPYGRTYYARATYKFF